MGGGEKLDMGGVEDLNNKVAMKEMPEGAIGGGVDIVAVAGEEETGHHVSKLISKGGIGLDKGLVDKVMVSDEDCRAGGDIEYEDGTMLAATSKATTFLAWVAAPRSSPLILHG